MYLKSYLKPAMAYARFKTSLKASFVIAGLSFSTLAQAQVIAKWTFESSVPNTAGPIVPERGNGSLIGFHANVSTTYSNPPGNGSSEAYSSNDWAAGDYYQFHVSTLGMTDIALSFEQTSSATGPKSFLVQTSTDGVNFTDLPSGSYDVGTDSWSATASSYVQASRHYFSLTTLDNLSDAYVRLTVAAGSTSANGGSIQGNGTSRLDNVSIGTSIALPIILQDFSIQRVSRGNLLLWKTKMEKDINYFSLERSEDGKTFTEIGKIMPLNNQLENDYSYTDESNNGFYRLNIYKKDGQSFYSKVIVASSGVMLSKVYCPVNIIQGNQPLKLKFSKGNFKYAIINYQGRVLIEGQTNNEADEVTIDVTKLKVGNYMIQILLNGSIQMIKFLKQ